MCSTTLPLTLDRLKKDACRAEVTAVVSNNISDHCVGNAGDIGPTHKGQQFTTKDMDLDGINCAGRVSLHVILNIT